MTPNTALIERIKAKCLVCVDCWIWQGFSVGGKHPQMKVSGKCTGVRRALYEASHGPMPEGMEMAATCETRNCVRHAEPQSHSMIGKRVGATGVFGNPARCAKIAAARREQSSSLTLEAVQDIRSRSGPLEQIAKRHGVSKKSVSSIRRGERWRDYANPFVGLGAR